MWAFYLPVLPRLVWLAFRFGGVRTVAAANPGMPDGGTVGESKADILAQLPAEVVLPFRRVRGAAGTGAVDDGRVAAALAAVHAVGPDFPVVLKPDVGERGRGVRIARSPADVDRYCRECAEAFLVQRYHSGPYEAGIFYYRFPDEAGGHILSITDKRFPMVIGDGVATLRALITGHPRYRWQAGVFLSRLGDRGDRVPAAGEPVQLAQAGNHSNGVMFLDGERLRTPELEARIDAVSRAYPGFFIGRFDVRFADLDAFRAGRDLAIVELNGATAEPTDLYDPAHSVVEGWRRLHRQWELVFRIGAMNRARGAPGMSLRRLQRLLAAHRRAVRLLSD